MFSSICIESSLTWKFAQTLVFYQCNLRFRVYRSHCTCVSLNRGLEYELSLILGPVQNQILYSREPLCVGTLRNSVSK